MENDLLQFEDGQIDEIREARADLMRKDDEGEDEGMEAIRKHEDCTDWEEEEN